MTIDSIASETNSGLDGIKARFLDNLKTLRTGRASTSVLDGVMVEAYGTSIPLKQAGNVVVADTQLLQITPFDPSNLGAISSAVRNDSSLGLNPSDDGRVVRIPIPPLTEERRKDLAKLVGQKQEEAMISARNIRHEAMDLINKTKKDKAIGEDEANRLTAQVEDSINKFRVDIEQLAKEKEKEILTL